MSVLSSIRLSRTPAIAFVIVGLFWGALAAQMPVIKARVGADDGLFGLLLLGTSLGLFTTMFLAPRIDRLLGRNALPFSAFTLASAFLLPGLAVTPITFFLAMCLAGLGSGLLDVIMNARVSELEARHGKTLMNANHGMFSVGYAASAIATGLAREAGLEPFTVYSVLFVIVLGLMPLLRMEVEQPQQSEEETKGFPHRVVIVLGVVVLIAFMGEAAVESWSALHIERTLGGRAAEGALGPAMLGLTMAVGRFSGQAVSERLSDLTVIFWAVLLAAIGSVIAAIAPSPMIAYVGFGIVGLGVSVIGPIGLALVGRLVQPEQRVAAISRAAVIGFSGFFVAPAAMGLISDAFGLRVAFGTIALLVLLVLPLLPLVRRLGG